MNWQEKIERLSDKQQEMMEQIILGFENEKAHEPIGKILHFETKTLPDGIYEMHMPIGKITDNVFGAVHGGVIATLADEAIGYFVNEIIQKEEKFAVTSDIHIRYISPGVGKTLIATPTIIKKGNRMIVATCEIKNEKEVLIALATSTYFILERK